MLSPSDNSAHIPPKLRDDLDAGARLVWVVAPEARTLTVYRAVGSARLLRGHDSVDGEEVLACVSIPAAEVLPEP